MGYKIGSFNLRNIGKTALGKKNDRDLQLIAQIIKREGFDVVAFQEVLREGAAFSSPESDNIKKSILMELGGDWDFRWAKAETQLNDIRNEGYAFLWNAKRLRPATTKTVDGKERVFSPRICNLNKKDMMRRPYYARFTPVDTISGGPWIELRLICVHTYFGKDDSEARKIRQNELDVLMKDIYPQIEDRRYGEYGNGMPSYTILMGDYNVILRRKWKDKAFIDINKKRKEIGKSPLKKPAELKTDCGDILIATDWDNRKIRTVQDAFTTLHGKTENGQEEFDSRGYINDYDHFSFEESRFKDIFYRVRKVDAVRKYCKDSFETYYNKVSDHIPIMMEIELKDSFILNEKDIQTKQEGEE